MSKREYVRQELADIENQLGDKDPGIVGEDVSDLAAIGLARYNPTITRGQLAKLVAEARRHGRTWDQIGSRLGMSSEEARRAYGDRFGGLLATITASGAVAAVLMALRHLLRNLDKAPRP
jgi:hypothetical protein